MNGANEGAQKKYFVHLNALFLCDRVFVVILLE
jgi:hypothetical protein